MSKTALFCASGSAPLFITQQYEGGNTKYNIFRNQDRLKGGNVTVEGKVSDYIANCNDNTLNNHLARTVVPFDIESQKPKSTLQAPETARLLNSSRNNVLQMWTGDSQRTSLSAIDPQSRKKAYEFPFTGTIIWTHPDEHGACQDVIVDVARQDIFPVLPDVFVVRASTEKSGSLLALMQVVTDVHRTEPWIQVGLALSISSTARITGLTYALPYNVFVLLDQKTIRKYNFKTGTYDDMPRVDTGGRRITHIANYHHYPLGCLLVAVVGSTATSPSDVIVYIPTKDGKYRIDIIGEQIHRLISADDYSMYKDSHAMDVCDVASGVDRDERHSDWFTVVRFVAVNRKEGTVCYPAFEMRMEDL